MKVDKVTMVHPGIEGSATVSRKAFEQNYQRKGWKLADEVSVTAPEVVPEVATPPAAPEFHNPLLDLLPKVKE